MNNAWLGTAMKLSGVFQHEQVFTERATALFNLEQLLSSWLTPFLPFSLSCSPSTCSSLFPFRPSLMPVVTLTLTVPWGF